MPLFKVRGWYAGAYTHDVEAHSYREAVGKLRHAQAAERRRERRMSA